MLNPLRQLANKVVGGECGPQLVENCAICLLLHFLDKEDVNLKSLSSLGFGTVDASLGKEALKVKFEKNLIALYELSVSYFLIQIVSYLTSKLPEGVLNYLRSEYVEEHSTEFGKDIKVYPVDEVSINGVEVLMEWGNSSKNYDGLVKKDISFKWEDTKVNETKVFEVFTILYVCTYFMMKNK